MIAIASLAVGFAHALADGHALDELVPFVQVFFAVWWAWINFTGSRRCSTPTLVFALWRL